MRTLRSIIITVIIATNALATHAAIADTLGVAVVERADSIVLTITTYDIETQLTFLMQGLTLHIAQADSLTLAFPSADMVRNKVRRHPNEVKAVKESKCHSLIGRDTVNQVIRPDVMPLVAALNDTTASITTTDTTYTTRCHSISVDRQTATMCFTYTMPVAAMIHHADSIALMLTSQPKGGKRTEFMGRRLSSEHAPQPNGLGEGIQPGQEGERTIRRHFTIHIDKL